MATLEARRLFAGSVVADLSPLGAQPQKIETTNPGRPAFFSGRSAAFGRELWTTDGTAAGTRMVVDLAPGAADMVPTNLVVAGKYAYFATDLKDKGGLYRSDGTAKGTIKLMDIGDAGYFVAPVDVGHDAIAFQLLTNGDPYNSTLWRSDGTAKGTRLIGNYGLTPPDSAEDYEDFVVASPKTGQVLMMSAEENQLMVSDGTKAGTFLVDVPGDEFAGLTSANGTLYFMGSDGKSVSTYRLDAKGKAIRINSSLGAGMGGDPYSGPAFATRLSKDRVVTFSRYEGGTVTDYTFRSRDDDSIVPLPLDKDAKMGGGGGTGLYITGRSIYATDDADRALRHVGDVPFDSIQHAAPTRDWIYAIGISGGKKSFREVVRISRADGHVESLYRTNDSDLDVADDDAPAFDEVNGRLLFRWRTAGGVVELFSIDTKTGRVTQLTNERGGNANTVVLAHAHAGGRSTIVSWNPTGGHFGVDLVEANGTTRRLYETAFSTRKGTSNFDPQPEVYDVRATAAGNTAYVSFRPGKAKSATLLRLDLRAGTLATISPGGTLLAVDGTRAYFDAGGAIWTTTGKAATTRKIGSPAAGYKVGGAVVAGGRVVLTTDVGLFAADASSLLELRGHAADAGGPYEGAPVVAGGHVFSRHGNVLIRTDGTVAGTLVALTTGQVGDVYDTIGSVVASFDGRWVYATVVDTSRGERASLADWRVVRVAADGTGGVETVVAAPPYGWRTTFAAPTLVAATADDLVLSGRSDQGVADRTLRVAPTGGETTRLVFNGSSPFLPTAAAYEGGILLTASGSTGNVVRLRNGTLRELPGFANLGDAGLTIADGVAYATGTSRATGRELFRHRLDTTISGTVFADLDADRGKGPGERGLADWRVWIDRDDDGIWDKNELFVRTDASGRFDFFELDPGSHKLRVGTLSGYESTTGYVYTVKLKTGEPVTKRFGARPIK